MKATPRRGLSAIPAAPPPLLEHSGSAQDEYDAPRAARWSSPRRPAGGAPRIAGRSGGYRPIVISQTVTLMAFGLTATLAAGACGGSSAPSKASYDKQADAICATYNSKLRAAGAGLASSSSVAQAEDALSSAVSLAQQGETKLESLKQPSGEGAQLKKVYAAQQAQVTDLHNAVVALKANNTAAAKSAISAAASSSTAIDQQFDALGLTTCGSGTSSST